LTSFFFVVDNAFMKKYSPLKLRNLEELQEFWAKLKLLLLSVKIDFKGIIESSFFSFRTGQTELFSY